MQTLAAATPQPGVLLKVLTAMHMKYSLISLAPLPWSVGLDTRKNPPHLVFHSLQVFFPGKSSILSYLLMIATFIFTEICFLYPTYFIPLRVHCIPC